MQHLCKRMQHMQHIKITKDQEVLEYVKGKKDNEKDVYVRYYNNSRSKYVIRKIDLSQPVSVYYAGTTGNKIFHYYDSGNTGGWRNAIINQFVYFISDK